MARVAFLGLGVMGYPMAGHLARAGHEVTVYNRTAAKADAWLAQHGGRAAPTPRAAAEGADVVVVTDHHPRSEDPARIRRALLEGARLGGDVRFAGSLGADTLGDRIAGLLRHAGVDMRAVKRVPVPTTLAVTTFQGAEPTFTFYGEPPSYALLEPADVDTAVAAADQLNSMPAFVAIVALAFPAAVLSVPVAVCALWRAGLVPGVVALAGFVTAVAPSLAPVWWLGFGIQAVFMLVLAALLWRLPLTAWTGRGEAATTAAPAPHRLAAQ